MLKVVEHDDDFEKDENGVEIPQGYLFGKIPYYKNRTRKRPLSFMDIFEMTTLIIVGVPILWGAALLWERYVAPFLS